MVAVGGEESRCGGPYRLVSTLDRVECSPLVAARGEESGCGGPYRLVSTLARVECSHREQNMSCICTLVHVLAIRLFQWSGSATLAGGH